MFLTGRELCEWPWLEEKHNKQNNLNGCNKLKQTNFNNAVARYRD